MSVALVQGQVRFVSIVSFAIDPRSLRGLVPVGTEVDTFDDGQAPLSVVGLRFAENHLFGLPVPFASCYDQIQLRFYVRRKMGRSEWRRGMVHVRDLLPVSSFLSAGHVLYGEAYQRLPVTSRVRPPDPAAGRPGRAIYRWRSDHDVIHRLAVDFSGEPHLPETGSREEFLVARNWGYVSRHADLTREYRVDHPPWRVWSNAVARLSPGAGPLFGDRFSQALSGEPLCVLVAEGSRMEMHRPVTLPPLAPHKPAFVTR
jgi:hypothetical protein